MAVGEERGLSELHKKYGQGGERHRGTYVNFHSEGKVTPVIWERRSEVAGSGKVPRRGHGRSNEILRQVWDCFERQLTSIEDCGDTWQTQHGPKEIDIPVGPVLLGWDGICAKRQTHGPEDVIVTEMLDLFPV